jgi:hypothetical protein
LETCRSLVRELADDSGIEEGLYLDGSRQIELLGLRLGCLIPFLQDLGEGGAVDFDKLLQFVQVVGELLKSFLQRGEFGRSPGDAMAPRSQNLLLVEKGLETNLELRQVRLRSEVVEPTEILDLPRPPFVDRRR